MERADEFSITVAAVSIVQHELNKGWRSSVCSSQRCVKHAFELREIKICGLALR